MKPLYFHLLASVLLIIVCFILYGNTLSADFEFVYDDVDLIPNNTLIQSFDQFRQVIRDGRPLRTITFMIDHAIWGLNPVGFHLQNVIWHILTCLMLYFWLVYLQTGTVLKTASVFLPFTPLIVALLFAAHPIHTEAVAGIANRKEMLVTFFFLAAFFAFLKNRLWWDILAMLAFAFALFAKEVAITFPLILMLFDLCFAIRSWSDFKARIPRYLMMMAVAGFAFANYISARPIFILLTFLMAILLPILVHGIIHRLSSRTLTIAFWLALTALLTVLIRISSFLIHISDHLIGKFLYLFSTEQTRGLTYDRVLTTTIRSFWHNLQLISVPINLSADHYLAPSVSFLQLPVIASLMLMVIVLGIGIWSFSRSKIGSFAIFFYLINLLPVSNLIPAAYFVAERYLYLPSIAFCLIVGWGLSNLLTNKGVRPLTMAGLIVLIGLYSAKTISRNLDWRSNFDLWSAAIKTDEGNPHAHFYLGNAYRERGDLAYAERHYLRSIEIEPGQTRTLTNLGNIYFNRQDFDRAIDYYEAAIRYDWGKGGANREYMYNNLGTAYFYRKEFEKAVHYLEKAVEINASLADIRCNLGQAYARTGQNENARFEYQTALSLDPNYVEPYKFLGLLAYQEQDWAEVETQWAIYVERAAPSPARDRIEQMLTQVRQRDAP